MLAVVYFSMYLQLRCERLLAKCMCLFVWAKVTMQILSEKIHLRKKTSWCHTWKMLTVNANDTVRTVSFYCHKLLTATKITSTSQENATAWQGPPDRHCKGHWGTHHQHGPETEPCCSKQKLTIRKRVDNACVELSVCQTSSPWTVDSQQFSWVGWREINAAFPGDIPRARPELPHPHGYIGFAWWGFSSGDGGAEQVASVGNWQKLFPCPMEPMAAGSKTVPPLGKASQHQW